MLLLLILLPLAGALPLLLTCSENESGLGRWSCAVTGLTLLVMVLAVCTRFGESLDIPLCGIRFTLDGFRCIYGLVVSFMWFVSALLTPQYFRGHHHLRRYHFFFLLCLSFTMGVFLSADLYTTFLFFELMSLSSYAWVVQEESPDALDAGKTYLAIAVLGGLVTLMGLFLLYRLTGTLVIAQLPDACAMVTDRGQLWAAALCILFGFAAKAGVFPLHIWLPKAHPVAPAPASALLSGVLTKAGIFGALIITADLLPGEHRWGVLLLALGAVTMVLGAAIAVFSNNLKYILACSSLSQIGFILVGTAALALLGQHNALAAHGTVLYMMNHSLVKLTLFLLAGVVYCNTHALDLNQIRGFGRGKPLLHILFLCGACSLAGIPGFLGYISKTLVHESLVELAAESGSLGVTAVEWLFLFSGGLTAAYLTKIYAALFWQKPAASTGRTWHPRHHGGADPGGPAPAGAGAAAPCTGGAGGRPGPALCGRAPLRPRRPLSGLGKSQGRGHLPDHRHGGVLPVHPPGAYGPPGGPGGVPGALAPLAEPGGPGIPPGYPGAVPAAERGAAGRVRRAGLPGAGGPAYLPAGLPSPPPEIPPQRRAPRHDPRRTAHGAGGRRPAGHHPGHHPPDGGQPVLCPADGLPGIVHCPGVHSAVRFLIAKELPQPRGSSFVYAGNSCICPVGVIYCYIDMIAFRGRVPP